MNLHENREVFEEVLAAASLPVEQGGIGVRLAFLEKDYWVTRALRNLAESRFANQAVFKGGTSLSKACGVGYRFSEDIDIAITSDDGRSENQTRTLVGGIGKAVPPYVWYVDRCTLWTDIKVIWITAMKVLKRADINNVAATLGSVGSYTDSRYTMFEVLRFIP